MAAELPFLQQMLRATMNASCLHTSKLTPSEVQCGAPENFRSEKLIRAAAPAACASNPLVIRNLC
jgi:hypothetical protein